MGKYTEGFQGIAGQTARAEHVQSELEAVETGFNSVEVELDASIRVPDGESLARLDNAVTRALKFIRFDANGDPEAITAAMEWKGDWAATTAYLVGQVVRAPDANNNSLYVAVQAHTSGATFSVGSDWEVIVDLQGLNFEKYDNTKTASFSAEKGKSYLVDSSLNDITVTLPASPSVGDSPINLLHVKGDVNTTGQKVTIDPNGNNLMDSATTMDMDINDFSARFVWGGTTYGWRVRTV